MAGGLSTGLLITISEDSAFQQKLLSVEAKRLDLECDRWKLSLIVGTWYFEMTDAAAELICVSLLIKIIEWVTDVSG